MPHPVETIIEQAAALFTANTSLIGQTFTHRILSLAESQDELPASSVTYGDDVPQTDNMGFLESLLTVRTIAFAVNVDEVALRQALMEMRRQQHIALQADHTLGLDFVSDCRYGGAIDPQIIVNKQFCGAYESRWYVLYRMSRTNPGG